MFLRLLKEFLNNMKIASSLKSLKKEISILSWLEEEAGFI